MTISRWMALCCTPGHPTPLLNGVDGQHDGGQDAATPPSPPSQPGQGLGKTDTDSGGRDKKRARRDCHGEHFSNHPHRSSSDPDARLGPRSKVQDALLGFLGHVPMDNRHHLLVDSRMTLADGYGEQDAPPSRWWTL